MTLAGDTPRSPGGAEDQLGPVLVGMPGAGKSSVAVELADLLGMRAIDCDVEIARRAGRSIAALFAEPQGERRFRELERAVTLELLAAPATVVAAGGGAVLDALLRERLRQRGAVWLQAPPRVLAARLAADGNKRPLLAGAEGAAELEARLQGLLAERAPLYQRAAASTIATEGLAPRAVAEAIARQLRAADADADNADKNVGDEDTP